MLSLRSISNITERVAGAGGSRLIQTGRAARKTNTSKAITRNAPSPAIRRVATPVRRCRQMANTRAKPSGKARTHPIGNSKTIAAVIVMGQSQMQSRRDWIVQPRVASRELLWGFAPKGTPTL